MSRAGFGRWLDRLVDEKGLDLEDRFEVEGPSGTNSIPLGCVVEALRMTGSDEQAAIKRNLVRLDFANADVRGYFEHLAGALAS